MDDESLMALALREAKKGQWRTGPNPAVGSVVVRDGEVVGRGYHHRAGTPHAEINALAAAGDKAWGGTIYVTLEPCNHTGRTPPCSKALLAAGVRRVVIGMADPNRKARGGADFLAAQGIEVKVGVLESRCRAINRPFISQVTRGRPWVVMKAAVSLDGRIAARTGHSKWVTGPESRNYGHLLRDRMDAILVGSCTVAADDPSLTARPRGRRGRDPLRVVLDSDLSLPVDARLFNLESGASTMVFCARGADRTKGGELKARGVRLVEVARGPDGLDLPSVLKILAEEEIQSLLVEGGGRVHGSFLKGRLYDELNMFFAPVIIGGDGHPMCGPLGVARMDEAVRTGRGNICRLGDDFLFNAQINEV